MFELADLPYQEDALEPVISARTLRLHHGKHHANYVKELNRLVEEQDIAPASLETIIRQAAKSVDRILFDNAAQAWNHSFFWVCMTPTANRPDHALSAAVAKSFGGPSELKKAFVGAGAAHFGSGWVWLAANNDGGLEVRSTHDADDTLTQGRTTPLFVCDVWEHAYYLDHQSDRKGYLEAWFDALTNWSFASAQYAAALGKGEAWRHPMPLGLPAAKRAAAR
jgi:Fe-Mn family superoxide dismutase